MTYAYGITTSAVYGSKSDPDKPVKLVIDFSKAEQPNAFSIMEVARAAAVCIRETLPKNLGVPLVLKDKDKEVEFEPPFDVPVANDANPAEQAAPADGDKLPD